MSEMKAHNINDLSLHDIANCDFYLKSEADKVIAELEERIAELEKLNHELEEERRWRKFPDEKPKEDTKFLVINEKGFMQCCYYSPILHEFQIPVTHWMPLPSAPKEEK